MLILSIIVLFMIEVLDSLFLGNGETMMNTFVTAGVKSDHLVLSHNDHVVHKPFDPNSYPHNDSVQNNDWSQR